MLRGSDEGVFVGEHFCREHFCRKYSLALQTNDQDHICPIFLFPSLEHGIPNGAGRFGLFI